MNIKENLEKLTYFQEVAKVGSLKKAASLVHLAQPSLSKSIKSLEQAIGHPLFIRHSRGVTLTKHGDQLLEFCNKLFSDIIDLENKLENLDDSMAGHIRVGTYDSIASYFWPQFLKQFLPNHPNLKIEIETARSAKLNEKLINRELDLILAVEQKYNKNIITEVLKTDHFKFYQAKKKSNRIFEFESAPIIQMSEVTQKLLEEYHLDQKKIFNVTSLETVKDLAIDGIGIGLLPEQVAKKYLNKNQLEVIDLPNIPKFGLGEHNITIAYHRTNVNNNTLKAIINAVKEFPL